MSKLLITGGAGFIGSNFVHYWLKNHPLDHLTVFDKLTYAGHLENLETVLLDPRFSFIQGDICDYKLVRETVKDIDTIIHFAAETHVDRSLAGLEAIRLFNQTNVEGTITLLQAALEAGKIRFHHISTDEVFGDLPYDQPGLKFHEDFPYHPNSPYAISKASSDAYVRFYHHTYGLPTTISNCTNNYGPFQTPEKVIPRFLSLLLQGQKVKLYGQGQNIRDWLHVADHCRGIDLILQRGLPGQTYCLGGNNELSNYRLVELVLEVMSEITNHDFNFQNSVEFVADRPGHDRRYAMDTSKAKRELNWQPLYDFSTGFLDTVHWYTSPGGKQWLDRLSETTKEVRLGQDIRRNRYTSL